MQKFYVINKLNIVSYGVSLVKNVDKVLWNEGYENIYDQTGCCRNNYNSL